jgi:hypothetical protein
MIKKYIQQRHVNLIKFKIILNLFKLIWNHLKLKKLNRNLNTLSKDLVLMLLILDGFQMYLSSLIFNDHVIHLLISKMRSNRYHFVKTIINKIAIK